MSSLSLIHDTQASPDTGLASSPSADVFHDAARRFRADVLLGLRAPRKELSCKYFYDEVGSALFEQITELEEYYPTRTELAIMERHAAENSYKYSLPALNGLAQAGCFATERVWTDERQYFGVAYLTPRHSRNDRVLPGRVGGRAMLPAHEAIPETH